VAAAPTERFRAQVRGAAAQRGRENGEGATERRAHRVLGGTGLMSHRPAQTRDEVPSLEIQTNARQITILAVPPKKV